MREFWVRLVSMLAIVGVLLGYNSVLDVRAKEDEIARLSAQVAGNGQSDSAYLTMAKDMIPKIIDAQSADIDTISGATFSSTGIKNASEQALEKAVK